MFKVNKTPKRRHRRHFCVFIVNFEHISHLVLVFLLLTMEIVIAHWVATFLIFLTIDSDADRINARPRKLLSVNSRISDSNLNNGTQCTQPSKFLIQMLVRFSKIRYF